MAGEILLDGEDIYGANMRAQVIRTRIGMVFQKPNPFPAMSVQENVLAGLKLTKLRCDDHDALVERVAAAGQPVAGGARSTRLARWRALRRPAAAALHRAVARRRSRTCC